MAAQRVRLRVNAFFGDEEMEIAFPANWEVVECRMAGHDRTPLAGDQIRAALRNPIGSPRLSELARGQKQVVILFDDLTKPTPTGRLVPFVLEELRAGGIEDDQIRFLCGPGTHRYATYQEMAAKLGADVLARFPVYSHNIWDNLTYVGTTSRGTPVHLNREFVACDLRLALGGILAHPTAAFSAGGKIVMPGIAGMETVRHHHHHMRAGDNAGNVRVGVVEGNVFRLDLEEAARLGGLHFKVDCVVNNRREVVGVFAGDFVEEHRVGVRLAREVYQTTVAGDADVVVSNSYPVERQFNRTVWMVPSCLKEGGDVVLVSRAEEAQCLHQYSGRFGSEYGGPGYFPGSLGRNLVKAARVIVLSPQLAMLDRQGLGGEKVVWCREWGEVLALLAERHGPGTRAVVYPCASLQVDLSGRS